MMDDGTSRSRSVLAAARGPLSELWSSKLTGAWKVAERKAKAEAEEQATKVIAEQRQQRRKMRLRMGLALRTKLRRSLPAVPAKHISPSDPQTFTGRLVGSWMFTAQDGSTQDLDPRRLETDGWQRFRSVRDATNTNGSEIVETINTTVDLRGSNAIRWIQSMDDYMIEHPEHRQHRSLLKELLITAASASDWVAQNMYTWRQLARNRLQLLNAKLEGVHHPLRPTRLQSCRNLINTVRSLDACLTSTTP